MKVYLDPALKRYILPMELRDNSITDGKVFTKGTRIPIEDNIDTIRLFTAWSTKSGKEGEIDLDLAGIFAKEDSDGNLSFESVSYYNREAKYASFSGDIQHCEAYNKEDGVITAEYIDVDIKKAKEKGFKYFISGVWIFARAESFSEFQAFSGVQLLDELKLVEGNKININDSLFKMELNGEFQSHIACAIDLETDEIVVIDSYAESNQGANAGSMGRKAVEMKNKVFNAYLTQENMFYFMKLYMEANNMVPATKEDADILVSYNDMELRDNQRMFNVGVNLEKILKLLA